MRRVLRVALVIVGVLVLAMLLVVWALRPPAGVAIPPQADATFANVTVVNPGRGRLAGATLRIRDGRIESIAGAAAGGGNEKFVLPGLIDMHVHTPPPIAGTDRLLFGLLDLAHGVTTVRDVGNFDGSILALRSATAEGRIAWPRIFACGPLLDGDPPWWPGSRLVRDRADAHAVVDELARQGVDCIKAYSLLSSEALSGVRDASAAHRLPVIGHVPMRVSFESARLADIQHLTGVPASPAPDRRSDYFRWWGESWRDIDAARIDFVVRTSAEQQIAHTPTLVVWQGMAQALRGTRAAPDATAALLPSAFRELAWQLPPAMVSASTADLVEAAIPKMKELVRRLHAAGVKIQAGTDVSNPFVVPGASLHAELRNLVDSGLRPEEALEAATRVPGASLPVRGLGTIEVGAPADFVVLTADPTTDLANLATIETVVAAGRIYAKADLDAAIERQLAHADGWLYRSVARALVRVMAFLSRATREDQIH